MDLPWNDLFLIVTPQNTYHDQLKLVAKAVAAKRAHQN